ncbi:hypothetical protein [Sodaliphilus sp.]|uniref:hypothetical protein n=1 Tax=Sodaliphilus sp. TaxID=2815818 RepID=UPI00388EF7DE
MCIKKITLFVTAVLMAFAACAGNVEVTRGSVTVRLDGDKSGQPRLVRLQVLGDKIVRVSATPEKSFADAQSLVVIPQPPHTRSDIREEANEVAMERSQAPTRHPARRLWCAARTRYTTRT